MDFSWTEEQLNFKNAVIEFAQVTWLKQMEKPEIMEAALAKPYLSESFVQSRLDAIRTYGGYMTESKVERGQCDAIGGTLYSGSSDIQRVSMAHLVGF